MGEPDDSDAKTRVSNARLAGDYDAMPYVPDVEPMLDLERAFGLASVFGASREVGAADVLDIGCGVGVQLERAASQTGGRLVGTDISASACAQATQRLAAHCARTTIMPGDLLDLDPTALGTFDAIYCVGVIYVVPPQVRRRVFEIIGACLKPGGVAVLSYYSGAMGALRPQLNRLIRAAVDPSLPRSAQAGQARDFLRQLAGQFPPQSNDLNAQTVRMMASYGNDATLFHEALCEQISVLSTGEIEAALTPNGLGFTSYLHPLPYCGLPTSAQRANGADIFDFQYGGYRYAAYLKTDGRETPPSAALAPRWMTGLRRKGPDSFHDPALGTIRVGGPLADALDLLAKGPARRADLPAGIDADLQQLWQAGWLTPLA